MPLQGLDLELLRRDSFKFLEYETKFGADTLVKLYRIRYSGTKFYTLRSPDWSSKLYFHGTGHCGCLYVRGQNENEYNEPDEWKDDDEEDDDGVAALQMDGLAIKEETLSVSMADEITSVIKVEAKDWCKDSSCQTKGILNEGHRRRLIQRGDGHYFTAHAQTAKYFAVQKMSLLQNPMEGMLYSVFICRVRNVSSANFKYVVNDEHQEFLSKVLVRAQVQYEKHRLAISSPVSELWL
ncbi:hypothetical protein BGW39_010440 [Mortierella sp. 14UC]|nr:hypothetical protein BGW39_010440 [Mortierella sp. 14UC]